jgi:hypothetical protein
MIFLCFSHMLKIRLIRLKLNITFCMKTNDHKFKEKKNDKNFKDQFNFTFK